MAHAERGSHNASTKQSLTDYEETGGSKQRNPRTQSTCELAKADKCFGLKRTGSEFILLFIF